MLTITDKDSVIRMAPNFDYVISILDPYYRWDHNFGPKHLVVRMLDTERPNDKELKQQRAGVHQILNWVKAQGISTESRLLVNCHAGVSRSSAISWLILVMLGMDELKAFEMMYTARPFIWPNASIMAIGDAFLNRKGELSARARAISSEISQRRGSYFA